MDEINLKIQSMKYLTGTRLYRYFKLNNDKWLDEYTLNMEVSEKLLSMISLFEIIYRNKIHSILSTDLGKDYLISNKKPRGQVFT